MQISSTRKTYSPTTSTKAVEAPKPDVSSSGDPQDGWVGTALSVAGGVATLAGALTYQPVLTAGGALATAVGTGLTAHRVQKQGGMDTAAWAAVPDRPSTATRDRAAARFQGLFLFIFMIDLRNIELEDQAPGTGAAPTFFATMQISGHGSHTRTIAGFHGHRRFSRRGL